MIMLDYGSNDANIHWNNIYKTSSKAIRIVLAVDDHAGPALYVPDTGETRSNDIREQLAHNYVIGEHESHVKLF